MPLPAVSSFVTHHVPEYSSVLECCRPNPEVGVPVVVHAPVATVARKEPDADDETRSSPVPARSIQDLSDLPSLIEG